MQRVRAALRGAGSQLKRYQRSQLPQVRQPQDRKKDIYFCLQVEWRSGIGWFQLGIMRARRRLRHLALAGRVPAYSGTFLPKEPESLQKPQALKLFTECGLTGKLCG